MTVKTHQTKNTGKLVGTRRRRENNARTSTMERHCTLACDKDEPNLPATTIYRRVESDDKRNNIPPLFLYRGSVTADKLVDFTQHNLTFGCKCKSHNS